MRRTNFLCSITKVELQRLLSEALKAQKEAILEAQTKALKAQKRDLLSLLYPPGLVSSRLPTVVPDHPAAHLHGATATWTACQRKSRRTVVGAAHCGLYYRPFGSLVPVFLPPIMLYDAKAVRLPRGLLDNTTAQFVCHDILEVVMGPTWSRESVMLTDNGTSLPWGMGASVVVGLSCSVAVFGKELNVIPKGPTTYVYEKCLFFTEDSGEPGNSGALMYALGGASPLPIGTYFGTYANKRGLRPRGIIVPFPDKGEWEEFPIVTPNHFMKGTTWDVIAWDSTTEQDVKRTLEVEKPLGRGYKIIDGQEKYHVVLIDAATMILGQKTCGALHCGRAGRLFI